MPKSDVIDSRAGDFLMTVAGAEKDHLRKRPRKCCSNVIFFTK